MENQEDIRAAVAVSACLLGRRCRYDGAERRCEAVAALGEHFQLVEVCPEVMGGLPVPRVPAERRGERVMTRDGRDVTEAYQRGAAAALRAAQEAGAVCAVLKARSPACGSGQIHNGRFDGGLCRGDGVAAQLFKEQGISVFTEEELIIQIMEGARRILD